MFKKSDWNRHILTLKHMNANKPLQNDNSFTQKNTVPFMCKICNKSFLHSSSLSRHKNKCQQEKTKQICNKTETTQDLIMNMLEKNKELQQILIEQTKTIIELSKLITIENNEIL